MPLILKHQTEAEFLGRLRTAYMNSVGDDTINIGAYVTASIARGDWSDAQLRAAWGATAAAWNTVKADMRAMVDARAVVRGAAGR